MGNHEPASESHAASPPVEANGDADGGVDAGIAAIGQALAAIPSGRWILTAEHEERRIGILITWVQQVCFDPPMISVAIRKGRSVMPLISESRRFALCQIGDDDRTSRRRFAREPNAGEDPFLGVELIRSVQGNLPIPRTRVAFLECELACHMDVEGDHDLFVGKVVAGGRDDGHVETLVREDGFDY